MGQDSRELEIWNEQRWKLILNPSYLHCIVKVPYKVYFKVIFNDKRNL